MMTAHSIRAVAVIGAGTMGRGIAQAAAQAGCATVIHDTAEGAAPRAIVAIEATFANGVARGKVTADERVAALAALRPENDPGAAVQEADLVIEAVPEDLDLKREILRQADRHAPTHAILASNTSSLSIAALAKATARPERVIGLHFFNPVHIMKLVEVVVLEETDAAVKESAVAFAGALGKQPIVVRDSPGFATSRLGLVLGLEAMRMLEAGVAAARDIDLAMELGYNHPMGPLKLTDLVGLDVRLAIAEHLAETIDPVRFAPPDILRDHVARGRLGKKSGAGFYRWVDGEPIEEES